MNMQEEFDSEMSKETAKMLSDVAAMVTDLQAGRSFLLDSSEVNDGDNLFLQEVSVSALLSELKPEVNRVIISAELMSAIFAAGSSGLEPITKFDLLVRGFLGSINNVQILTYAYLTKEDRDSGNYQKLEPNEIIVFRN